MLNQPTDHPQPIVRGLYYSDEEADGPGLIDGIRFLYRRRMKLALLFFIFLGIGLFIFLAIYFSSRKVVSGTITLNFTGIEKQEYPSGRKFTVEDFRSPDLLTKAMAVISEEKVEPIDLAAHVYVTPVIPGDIQSRWKKQEKDGTRKEEYLPNEFKLEIAVGGLTDDQRLRLFDAVVKAYRDRVKYDQHSALGFVATWDTAYDKLAASYDFWDIPALFGDTYRLLSGRVNAVIVESLQSQDPKYQLTFRGAARDLNAWYTTRLMALEALTYQGKLVKNRDIMIQRVQYRIEDLDIQIRQKTQEAKEATNLLGIIEQPKAMLAGGLGNKEGLPILDASALDRLIKSDYVGPVVQRISKLQEEIQAMEADKARLAKQLSWLPKASNLDLSQLPSGHRELIETLSSELKTIADEYNRLLDEYLVATITSKVLLKQSPIVARDGYSPILLLVAVTLLSAFLAVFYLGVEHLARQAKQMEKEAETAHKHQPAAS